MPPITADLVEKAAKILGHEHMSEKDMDLRLDALTSDRVVSARLLNFIPEAFAYAFIPHLPDGTSIVMPKCFSARSTNGEWNSVPLLSEPIFLLGAQLGMHMYHNGPRATFKAVVSRSAMLDCVNKLLNSGESLAGANMSGLTINGVSAEVYSPPTSEA
jgi:hypothetical protein